jgi:hypothetical protein
MPKFGCNGKGDVQVVGVECEAFAVVERIEIRSGSASEFELIKLLFRSIDSKRRVKEQMTFGRLTGVSTPPCPRIARPTAAHTINTKI